MIIILSISIISNHFQNILEFFKIFDFFIIFDLNIESKRQTETAIPQNQSLVAS